jgi:hypothetical protein
LSKSVERDGQPVRPAKETSEIRTLPSTAPPPPLAESGLSDAHQRALEAFLKGEPEPPELAALAFEEAPPTPRVSVRVPEGAERMPEFSSTSVRENVTRPTARPPAFATTSKSPPVPKGASRFPAPSESESALLGRAVVKETSEIRTRTPAVVVEEVVPSTRRDHRRE